MFQLQEYHPIIIGQMIGRRFVGSIYVSGLTQLCMGADPNDPVVDRSSLRWVMEDFHDRSRIPCLRFHNGRVDSLVWGIVATSWRNSLQKVVRGEIVLYLAVEEVFWEVKGQGKYREQEPPNSHCRVARSI